MLFFIFFLHPRVNFNELRAKPLKQKSIKRFDRTKKMSLTKSGNGIKAFKKLWIIICRQNNQLGGREGCDKNIVMGILA